MKIPVNLACQSCGTQHTVTAQVKERFPTAICPKCGAGTILIDRLSISVIADRLLMRSQAEIANGDYTISIICSAVAVECALTSVFLKWKEIDHLKLTGNQPTEENMAEWESEYKKGTQRGFKDAANFVAEFLCGKKFEEFCKEFLEKSKPAAYIRAGLPPSEGQLKLDFIWSELFYRRNRIMHWGEMDYKSEDASAALSAAQTAINILKLIDKEKYEARERAWRESVNSK